MITSLSRRKFLYIAAASSATIFHNACSKGWVNKQTGLSADALLPSSTAPSPDGQGSPTWALLPTIAFTVGVPGFISIAAYVNNAGHNVAVTLNNLALPIGVTYDAASKGFVYDGSGPVALTEGHILTATVVP
ncbi:MAG: hypothetical protein H7256_07200 [Bdellovibrio sp.]|nr:hypothetical protein [Bdellovibrio sp.]